MTHFLKNDYTLKKTHSALTFTAVLKVIVYIMVFLSLHFVAAQQMLFAPVEGSRELNEEKIRNIIELNDGRIGIFTEGMLNLYDGGGFTTIHLDDLKSAPLISYAGFHHGYTEGNHIWFKNIGKLYLVNTFTEDNERSPLEVLKNMGFKGTPVDLFVDDQKDVWIVTKSGGLLCYNQRTKTAGTFLQSVQPEQNKQDAIYDIVYANKHVYLFYRSGLVRCLNRETAKEVYRTSIFEKTSDEFNNWMHATVVNGYIYIVSSGMNSSRLTRITINTHEVITLLKAENYWLNTFTANNAGDFVVSSNKGLWRFKSGSTSGSFLPRLNVAGDAYITTEVSTVFYDSWGGFWAGTLNKGLYYYHPDRFRFPLYQKKYFNIQEDAELQVNCFTETHAGTLLVGTNAGLFAMQLPLSSTSLPAVPLSDVNCKSILTDSKGITWIGTPNGIYTCDRQGTLTLHHPAATNYLYEAKDGLLYACTLAKGLLRWDKASGSFIQVCNEIALPNIVQLTEWNGQLTGISAKGPFFLDSNTGKLTLSADGGHKLPMFRQKNHRYTCMLADSGRDLWVGTYDGLTVWNSRHKKLYRIDTDTGLVNNSIKSIAEGNDQSVWVTTSRGISHIIKDCANGNCTFKIINYYRNTGVLEHPFTERSAFVSKRSGVFFGGIDGMNHIPVKWVPIRAQPLKPLFLSLKIFGRNIKPLRKYDQNTVLSRAMTATDTLILNYDQNFFTIGFSGLNYVNPTGSHFRYKLKGVDDTWRVENQSADYGEANYTGVAPGNYTFTLQASTDGVNWAGIPANMTIIIKPPLWKTHLAKMLYLAALIFLTWFTISRINIRIRTRRRQEHVKAVENAKANFITNMSHELRTPLTLIITPLQSLIQKISDRTVKEELQRIGNNAHLLLDTVNQLLEFKKTDVTNEALHLHYCNNLSFIEDICNAYTQTARDKNIVFTTRIPQEDLHMHIDTQKVTRIVINLLSNAFKFTPAGGIVNLYADLDQANAQLTLTVKDTGIGINSTETGRIFERFYQADNHNENTGGSGIGLYMVRHYATLHGGSATVKSDPGAGSCFVVTLKVTTKTANVCTENNVQHGKKTLLLVEDHPGFRDYLSNELISSYNVITAVNGKSGLEKAEQYLPDVIITDMVMPEMDGASFCKAVRSTITVSHTPIIMLTGRASDEAHFKGYESGADAYLTKPFDIHFLLLRITKLLELSMIRHKAFTDEENVAAETITNNPLDREMLERAFKYVERNLSNPDYSVERFSADMGMDRTGLYRKLLALTGHSPVNFIRTIRLKKAADLLRETTMPVTSVAVEVGFNSTSYFSKCFSESYNKTPSQYRESIITKK